MASEEADLDVDTNRPGRMRSVSVAAASSRQDVEELLRTENQDLLAMIDEKESEIQQLAELGKSLLDRNQDAEKQLQAFRQTDAQKNEVIEYLQNQVRELEETQEGLRENRGSHNEFMEKEYRSISAKYTQLAEEMEDLQSQHNTLSKESKKKERQIMQEVTELRAQSTRLMEAVESTKQDLYDATSREQELKKTSSSLESENRSLHDQLQTITIKLRKGEELIHKLNERVTSKDREVLDLKEQMEEFDEQVRKRLVNEGGLQETIANLVRKNHLLQQENEELNQHLQSARNTIQETAEQIEERQQLSSLDAFSRKFHPKSGTNSESGKEEVEVEPLQSSLFSELEASLKQQFVEKPMESATSLPASSSGFPGMSESEYFYLAAAAVKIGLLIKFPEKSSDIMKIDIQKMFQRARDENIPFHEWHSWITVQFGYQMYNADSLVNSGQREIPTAPRGKISPREIVNAARGSVSPRGASLGPGDQLFIQLEKKGQDYDPSHQKEIVAKSPMMSPHISSDHTLKAQRLFNLSAQEYVIKVIGCALDEIKGEMFVTQYRIWFYAQKPGSNPPRELKIGFSFSDIISIRKPGSLVMMFGLNKEVIYAKTKSGMKFTFGGFGNQREYEETFDILSKMWMTEDSVQRELTLEREGDT